MNSFLKTVNDIREFKKDFPIDTDLKIVMLSSFDSKHFVGNIFIKDDPFDDPNTYIAVNPKNAIESNVFLSTFSEDTVNEALSAFVQSDHANMDIKILPSTKNIWYQRLMRDDYFEKFQLLKLNTPLIFAIGHEEDLTSYVIMRSEPSDVEKIMYVIYKKNYEDMIIKDLMMKCKIKSAVIAFNFYNEEWMNISNTLSLLFPEYA